MKILMATMGLDIGGAETHIVELAKELKAEGHDIVVASNGGVYVPEIVAAGIRHYQVPMHRRDAGCMLRSRKLLKEIIRTERPDVVHAHARIPAFLCGTLQRTMKFPFVTTAHWVFTTKGGLRYLTNWGQRTVAVSDDIKAYLIREYGVPEEHISVTINGIDTEKFSPQTSGQSVVEEFGLDRSRPNSSTTDWPEVCGENFSVSMPLMVTEMCSSGTPYSRIRYALMSSETATVRCPQLVR